MKVQISDECKKAFDSLKFGHTYRYLVFKINKTQGESIVLDGINIGSWTIRRENLKLGKFY